MRGFQPVGLVGNLLLVRFGLGDLGVQLLDVLLEDGDALRRAPAAGGRVEAALPGGFHVGHIGAVHHGAGVRPGRRLAAREGSLLGGVLLGSGGGRREGAGAAPEPEAVQGGSLFPNLDTQSRM